MLLKNHLPKNISRDLKIALTEIDIRLDEIRKEYADYKSKFGYYDNSKISEEIDYFLDDIRAGLKDRNDVSLDNEEYAEGNEVFNLMNEEEYKKLFCFLLDLSCNLVSELKDLKSNELTD